MHTIIAALERSLQLVDHLDEDDLERAALRAEIEAALVEARKLLGNGRPVFNSMHVHAKIRGAIAQAGSCSAWGRQIGISKSYAFDVSSGIRPPSDRVLATLGLAKKHAGRDQFLEL